MIQKETFKISYSLDLKYCGQQILRDVCCCWARFSLSSISSPGAAVLKFMKETQFHTGVIARVIGSLYAPKRDNIAHLY